MADALKDKKRDKKKDPIPVAHLPVKTPIDFSSSKLKPLFRLIVILFS